MYCRRIFETLCVCAVLFLSSLNAQEEEPLPVPGTLQVPFAEEGSWTMAVIPDTQAYVRRAENQGILELMTGWLQKSAESENIRVVIHVGDMVDRNNISSVSSVKNTNQLSSDQWEAVRRAMKRLSEIPTVIVPGNHDYGNGPVSAETRDSHLDAYFPVNWNPANTGHIVSVGKNAFEDETLENAAYEFPFSEGKKMLILALEYSPSDRSIEWAKDVTARDEYKDAFVIVVTHSYLDGKGNRITKSAKNPDTNNGQKLWEKLIYPSDNIRMVICGHIGSRTLAGSSACTADLNHNGAKVWQLLFDTQAVGDQNGGDGWIRLLRFSGDAKSVRVQTFSPLFNISPTTRDFAWDKTPFGEFGFELE